MAELPLVVATGTPEQIGHAYGRAARAAIAANLDAYLARFAALGAAPAAVRAHGERFRATTRAHHPRIAATLDGVADGAGRPAAEVYALNARTELIMGLSLGVLDGGCTALGLAREGRTLLAQNWDWSPAQRETTLVLATRDERGHAVVALAEAGMLAKAGVSSAGVGVCVNILASDRDGRPGGIPYHVLLRAALEAPAFAQAALALCAGPRSASLHALLGAAGGELAGIELAPGELGCAWPHDGALAHANHFEACAGVGDLLLTLAQPAASSRARAARARALLRRLGAGAGEAQLAEILRDHDGLPICVHAAPGAPSLEQETLASVLIDLDARRLSVAAGPPCRAGYVPYAVEDVF